MVDISRMVRTKDNKPVSFSYLYVVLRENGIEPNRGGGKYIRTPDVRRRYRETRYSGKTPGSRGWRANDEDED